MFYLLILAAIVLFVMHVALLFTAFHKSQLQPKRYFYSHLTLWLTGIAVYILVLLYSGHGRSGFLDYFDSPQKALLILAFTFLLSLVAHLLVRFVVMPMIEKSN